jgi:methionyl-tRNA formyltransferase
MEKIKLAYFGSPDFAADFLKKILLDKSLPVAVKLVVTQPDSPVGRKQILTPTPVKKMAEKYKGSEDTDFSDFSISEKSRIELTNIDLALVYAFGELIPKEILNLPKFGFWNIHPSLLPKYRGTSPVATALINGNKKTGVTIIKMDEEIDHGPMIAQESLTIDQDDKRPDLEKKLTNLAFEMFKDIIKKIYGQDDILSLQKTTQDHILATYTKKLTKQDGFIPFENWKLFRNSKLEIRNSSEILFNHFRGLYPWPGIWTLLPNNKRLKITDMKLINGKLIIKKVQLEGKKEVDFKTFNKAYKIF